MCRIIEIATLYLLSFHRTIQIKIWKICVHVCVFVVSVCVHSLCVCFLFHQIRTSVLLLSNFKVYLIISLLLVELIEEHFENVISGKESWIFGEFSYFKEF